MSDNDDNETQGVVFGVLAGASAMSVLGLAMKFMGGGMLSTVGMFKDIVGWLLTTRLGMAANIRVTGLYQAALSGLRTRIAAVALANGLNANFLRSWVKAHRDQLQSDIAIGVESASGRVPAKRSTPPLPLVPVRVQPPSDETSGTIELEIRRQQTVVAIRWPASEATACGQWLRDLLR